jgi:hypothetical protein
VENYRGSPNFWATFSTVKSYVLILTKKMGWVTVWAIFHKLIWSPCGKSGPPDASEANNNGNDFSVNRCDYGSLKDMPKAVVSLLTNKTYMCISIGAALDAFLLAGNDHRHLRTRRRMSS